MVAENRPPGQLISFREEQVFRAMSSDVVLHGLSRLIEEGKDAACDREDPEEADWYFGLYVSIGTLVDPANVDNQPARVGEEAYRNHVRQALGYMEFVGVPAENLSAAGIYEAYRREVRVPESIGMPEGVTFLPGRDISTERASRRKKRKDLVNGVEGHLDTVSFDELNKLMRKHKKLPSYVSWKASQGTEARQKYKEFTAAQQAMIGETEAIGAVSQA